jgi:hypothetical protein
VFIFIFTSQYLNPPFSDHDWSAPIARGLSRRIKQTYAGLYRNRENLTHCRVPIPSSRMRLVPCFPCPSRTTRTKTKSPNMGCTSTKGIRDSLPAQFRGIGNREHNNAPARHKLYVMYSRQLGREKVSQSDLRQVPGLCCIHERATSKQACLIRPVVSPGLQAVKVVSTADWRLGQSLTSGAVKLTIIS